MKIFYKIIIISLLFLTKTNAANGPATEYKISLTLLELCDSTSTLTSCNNPVVIGSGDSGVMDIAGTAGGAAAGSFGSLSTAPIGTTFTYMQITMKREITATGYGIWTGTKRCYTDPNSANDGVNAAGVAASGSSTSATLYLGVPDASIDNGDATNSATAGDGTGTSRAVGVVTAGDDFLEFRQELTKPLTIKPGAFPTVKVAFGTSTAIGAVGNMTDACTATGATAVGLYGAAPDVTITFE